jgi:thiamine-phosphate pyrophosphorylase
LAPREELIRYAISSNYDLSSLESIILRGATHILFRDKDSRDITKKAREFIENLRSKKSIKKLLHSEYLLAKELGFDGVHFSSKDFDKIVLAKELNLLVVVSTHNDKEIKLAIKNGADMICYSPIFKTPKK